MCHIIAHLWRLLKIVMKIVTLFWDHEQVIQMLTSEELDLKDSYTNV